MERSLCCAGNDGVHERRRRGQPRAQPAHLRPRCTRQALGPSVATDRAPDVTIAQRSGGSRSRSARAPGGIDEDVVEVEQDASAHARRRGGRECQRIGRRVMATTVSCTRRSTVARMRMRFDREARDAAVAEVGHARHADTELARGDVHVRLARELEDRVSELSLERCDRVVGHARIIRSARRPGHIVRLQRWPFSFAGSPASQSASPMRVEHRGPCMQWFPMLLPDLATAFG